MVADMAAGAEAGAFSSSPDARSVPRECSICSVSFDSERAQMEHDVSSQHHLKLDKAEGGSVSHYCSLCKQTSPNIKAFIEHTNSEPHRQQLQESRRITAAPSHDRPLAAQGSSVNWSTGKREIFGHSMDALKQSSHRRSSLTKPLPYPMTKTPKGKESKGPFRKKGKGADRHQAAVPGAPTPPSGSAQPAARGAEKIRKIMHTAPRPPQKMGELPSFLPLDSSSITKPASPSLSGDDGGKMLSQSSSKDAALKHREAIKKKPHLHSPGKKFHSSGGNSSKPHAHVNISFVHRLVNKGQNRAYALIPAEQLQRMKLNRDSPAVTSSSKRSPHTPDAQPPPPVTSGPMSLSSSTAKKLPPAEPPVAVVPSASSCPPNYRFPSPVIPPPRHFVPPQHLLHPRVIMESLPPPPTDFRSSTSAPYPLFPQPHSLHPVPPQPPAGIRPFYHLSSAAVLPNATTQLNMFTQSITSIHPQSVYTSGDMKRPIDTSSPLSGGSSDYEQKDMDISESSETEMVPSAPSLPKVIPSVPQPSSLQTVVSSAPDIPTAIPSAPQPPSLPTAPRAPQPPGLPMAPRVLQPPSLPTEISSAPQPSPGLPTGIPHPLRSPDLPTKVSNVPDLLTEIPSVSLSSGLSSSRPASLFCSTVNRTTTSTIVSPAITSASVIVSPVITPVSVSSAPGTIVSPVITSASTIVSPAITSASTIVSPVITSASTIVSPAITSVSAIVSSKAPTHVLNSPGSAGSSMTPLSPSGKAKRPLVSSHRASPPPLKKARRSLSYSEGTDPPLVPVPNPSPLQIPSPEAMSPQEQCQFLHKSGTRCLQPSHNDTRLCKVHLAVSLAIKEQLGLSPGRSSRRKTHPVHHFRHDDIATSSCDQMTEQSSSAPMDAPPGGDSSAAGDGGGANTSGSADSSSPSGGSSVNGGDSDSGTSGGSNGGQGAPGGDGDRGNNDNNAEKNSREGMQDRLAELNKQEGEIQTELVQTYHQVTQVTREREQLEERLQLLRQREQQLTDKQQSLSEQYRDILDQKQSIILSCFISPPSSAIKMEIKPIISLPSPSVSTTSSITSSTTVTHHTTAHTSQPSFSTTETPMETSSDPSACFSPPLSVIKTKSKTQKKFTPKRLQLTPKKPIQSLKPSSGNPSSHNPPVVEATPVITASSRPSDAPHTIETLRNSPTTIRRQSGSSTDTGSSSAAMSKTGSNAAAATLTTGSNAATILKTGSNTVAATPKTGSNTTTATSKTGSNTALTTPKAGSSTTTATPKAGSNTSAVPKTTSAIPKTGSSTSAVPTTGSHTSAVPKTGSNTSAVPKTGSNTSAVPKTGSNTSAVPTTGSNTSAVPTTGSNTSAVPKTGSNTSAVPTTGSHTSAVPKTGFNTSAVPTTGSHTSAVPKTGSNTSAVPKTGSNTSGVPKTGSNTSGIPKTGSKTSATGTPTPKTSTNTTAISKAGSNTTAVPKTVPNTASTPVLKSNSHTTLPSVISSSLPSSTVQSSTTTTQSITAVLPAVKVEKTVPPPCQEVAGGSQGTSSGSSSADTTQTTAPVPLQFESHTQSVLALKVYNDLLFSCSIDKSIRAYSIKTGKRVKTFDGHSKTVTCLEVYHSVRSDNSYVLSGSSDKTIQMHSIKSGRLVAMFKCTTRVMYLAVCGKLLFVAQNNGNTAIINLEDKKLVGRQECHDRTHAISCIAATKTQLFTAAFDNLIKCWDIKSLVDSAIMEQPNQLKLAHTISSFNKTVLCLKIQDQLLFCGSADHSVQVYDLKSWTCLHKITCHRNTVSGLHIMGKLLITASFDRYIRCFDIERMELVQVYGGHPDMIFSVTADRNVVYTGARDGSVRAIPINLNVFYSCKWSNCQLRFGVADHLVAHVLEDHCKDIVSTPVSCLWSKCSSAGSFDKPNLLKAHLTTSHVEPNQ